MKGTKKFLGVLLLLIVGVTGGCLVGQRMGESMAYNHVERQILQSNIDVLDQAINAGAGERFAKRRKTYSDMQTNWMHYDGIGGRWAAVFLSGKHSEAIPASILILGQNHRASARVIPSAEDDCGLGG